MKLYFKPYAIHRKLYWTDSHVFSYARKLLQTSNIIPTSDIYSLPITINIHVESVIVS